MKRIYKISALITAVIMLLTITVFTSAAAETPIMTIACISDLHNQENILNNSSIRGSILTTCKELENENVDVLLIGGDLSSDTQVSQTKLMAVLDNVVNATSAVTENVLWVAGNHDYSCGERDGYDSAPYYDLYMKDHVGELSADESYYETYNDQRNLLAYHYVINGFDFVGISTAHSTLAGNLQNYNYAYTDGAMSWVDQKLDEIGRDKTVILFGHFPLNDSDSLTSGKGMVADCSATFKGILAKYPNLIYLYGHDHGSDSAYVRTDTKQRVTEYMSDGTKKSAQVQEISNSLMWTFDSVADGYTIKNVDSGKYLGIDGNLNTVDSPIVWTATGSETFSINYENQSIHCGTGNKFSHGTPSPITLYKKNGTGYTAVNTITTGESYLIVAAGNCALSPVTNGSTGTGIRLEPAVVELTSGGSESTEPATPSFVSSFMGSMRYFNNSIDGSVGASDAKIIQNLMIYIYADRIELKMINRGIMNGGSEDIRPYIIQRTVIDTSSLVLNALNTAKENANEIKNAADYTEYTDASRDALEVALADADRVFVYQADINTVTEALETAVAGMAKRPAVVDKTALRLAIDGAELIIASPGYTENYNAADRSRLESQLETARALLASTDATLINSAISELVLTTHMMSHAHSYTVYVYNNNATCTGNGTKTAVCDFEGCDETDTLPADNTMLGHDWATEWTVDAEPTCDTAGSKSKHCTRCDEKNEITLIEALGHDWDETGRTDATCTEDGVINYVCSRDNTHTKNEPIAKLGHDWATEWTVDAEPTCDTAGSKSKHCTRCDEKNDITVIEALGHDWVEVNRIGPTCTIDGVIKYVCSRDNTHTKNDPITKLGHTFDEYLYDNNATAEKDGTNSATCPVCGMKDTVTAPGTKLTAIDSSVKFTDVSANKWFKEYVDYAVTCGLFKGTSETTFEPDKTMTRAMFVQVLANLEGIDTEALRNTETGFRDVATGKWYTGAVKWACDNGISNGATPYSFMPDADIDRQQMCTMLVRYATVKGILLNKVNAKVVFADDADIASYARESVYACQQAGIVNGMTATEFAPKNNATRGQVAKILTVYHKNYKVK